MGFGGSRWTKDYAVKIIVYAVSVGAKLFVLQLLVGMGEAMIREWVENFEANYPNIFLMVGSAIVMLAVTKIVPEMVQGLINGTSVSSGSSLTGAAAAVGGATVRAAAGVVGAGMAVGAAGQLASAQVAASTAAGAGPASSMARMAQLTGHTFKNLGKLRDRGPGPSAEWPRPSRHDLRPDDRFAAGTCKRPAGRGQQAATATGLPVLGRERQHHSAGMIGAWG
jgi:type IV secretory pathway TrbL component